MRRSLSYILVLTWLAAASLAFIAPARSAFAEVNISQSVSPTSGSVEDVFSIEVTVSGPEAQDFSAPSFSSNRQFTIEFKGKSSQHSIIQGHVTSATTYTFSVVPDPNLSPGRYSLPQGQFKIGDGSSLPLKVLDIQLRKPDRKHRRKKLGVDFTQIVDNPTPYVGQQVLYRAEVVASSGLKEAVLSEPKFTDVWVETFGDSGDKPRRLAQSNTLVYAVREALFPIKSGTTVIPARELLATVRKRTSRRPRRPGGRFFDIWPSNPYNYTDLKRRLIAPAINLQVRPLPTPPETGLRHIPVGKVELKSGVSQWTIKEGENIALSIILQGDANLRPYELPDAAALGGSDFKVYYDKPQLETKKQGNRIIFTKRYQVAMVPQKPGSFTLPAVRVVTFDPYAEEYKILKTDEHKIIVRPNPQARRLVGSVPQAFTAPTDDRNKQQVTFLSEDLFPQHIGAHTFGAKRELDSSAVAVLLVLMPLAAIGWRIYNARYERLYGNPEIVAQRNAFADALAAIKNTKGRIEEATLDSPRSILVDYIGARYRVKASAYTPAESAELVREKLNSEELASRVNELLKRLERMRYSAAAKEEPQKLIADCLDEVKGTVEELEKLSPSVD